MRWPAFLFFVFFATPLLRADILTLKDGTVLVGQVLEGDEKGIRLKRFDTGGVLFLPWDFLCPRDAQRLRKERGLDLGEVDFLRIPGVRIELVDHTVHEGVILERKPDQILLYTARRKLPIPRQRILREEPVQVSAVDVYPPEELYQQRLAEKTPQTVTDHFELAKFCLQIELFDKALEHFAKVQELDPKFKPDFVRARMNECQELLKHQAVAQLFNKITRLLYADRFREALDLIATLEESEELDETWKARLAQKKEEAEKKREAFYVRAIASLMPRYIRSIAAAAGKDPDLSWQAARRFAGREFSRELRAKLAQRLGLEEREVRDLIRKIKSYQQIKVSYGHMTWFAPGERPPRFQRRRTNRSWDRRGRFRRARDRRTRPQERRLPRPDEVWAAALPRQRADYIHALWAERAPEVHVVRIERRACTACGGRGTNRTTGEGGIVEVRCWRCRGIASDRVVVYRIGPGQGVTGGVRPGVGPEEGLTPAERLRRRLLERRRRGEEPRGGGERRWGRERWRRGGDRRGR